MQVRSANRVDSVLEIFELSRTETTLLQFAYFVAYLLVAPPMGIFMRRYGYKIGIHVGLALFSIGVLIAYYYTFSSLICEPYDLSQGLYSSGPQQCEYTPCIIV